MSEDQSNWHRPARLTGPGKPSQRRRGPELPLLGLMLGDSTGIGPELCARILADMRLADAARLLVVGDTRLLARGARDAGVAIDWRTYSTPEEVDWNAEEIPIIDLGNLDPAETPHGALSALAGRVAGGTPATMIRLALARRPQGLRLPP